MQWGTSLYRAGEFRIFCRNEDEKLIVLFIAVGNRREIYRQCLARFVRKTLGVIASSRRERGNPEGKTRRRLQPGLLRRAAPRNDGGICVRLPNPLLLPLAIHNRRNAYRYIPLPCYAADREKLTRRGGDRCSRYAGARRGDTRSIWRSVSGIVRRRSTFT